MPANADYRAALEGHNTTFQIMVGSFMAKPTEGEYSKYTNTITDTSGQLLVLATLANAPQLRKWNGARVLKEPRAYTNTIRPYTYESTMTLPRVMVNNDKSGAVSGLISASAKAVIPFFDKTVAADYLSASGAGPTGPDGVALFSASHPYADSVGGTQSNIGSGTNLSHSNLITGETAMGLLTEENGENFGVLPTDLDVGPRLRRRAQELTGADRVVVINQDGTADAGAVGPAMVNAAAARSNVLSGDYTVNIDRRNTGYYWTLRDSAMPPPMILFVTRTPEVINQLEMTDERRYQFDQFTFGIEADVGTGAWAWMGVYRGTGTG